MYVQWSGLNSLLCCVYTNYLPLHATSSPLPSSPVFDVRYKVAGGTWT